ncbi:MAG: hypothetical protein M1484_05170 [Patescibacteria group bacterium]|nr:hypothetical protein [Patescibacteria group bacterium]MCL5432445.1 hypothetical protein [Patescibacteria group bacterium]
MSTGLPSNIKTAREEAIAIADPRFEGADRRDVVFLLTCVNLARAALRDRPNFNGFYGYAVNNQEELLLLARQFDQAIGGFNQTAGSSVDPKFQNTLAERAEDKLGPAGTIPLFLGNGVVKSKEALTQLSAGEKALRAQGQFMKNSERAINDPEFLQEITESGEWSRIHLTAIDFKHFLAMFIIDLYPMMLQRTGQYREMDSDELVRALCEQLDPKSECFRLIRDQGWINESEFSKKFVDETKRR